LKFRHRILWTLVWTGLLLSAALSWTLLLALRAAAADAFRERVRAEVRMLAVSLPLVPGGDPQAVAVDAGRRLGLRVTLIDGDGVVLGDSSMDRSKVPGMENHRGRPEVVAASVNEEGESLRRSGTTGLEFFYVARRIEGAGWSGFVRIAAPSSLLVAVPRRQIVTALLAPFTGFLILGALVYRRARREALTLEDLAGAAAGAEPGFRLSYEGADEIGDLAAATNRAFRALEDRIDELEGQRVLASRVISEMREGMLVVDLERRISLANAAFRRIFRLRDDPVGHRVAEVLRAPSVMRDLDAALDERTAVTESVFQSPDTGRSFEIHVTPLGEEGKPGGALVLFFDITRLEALEGVRREFVANVSHELRTPLTSIKAFVETLLDGGIEDPENGMEFLRIVRKHAGRMEELIDDLTDLSLIETGAIQLDLQTVDAGDVAREVATQVSHRHPTREVTVAVKLPHPFPVRADRRRLEQILLNLVDNAVKFSHAEGEVRIRGERVPGSVTLAVEDDGIGIPPDSLEKVFHRFYRVDKARSREVGGTGLGLAIVKHLVRLQGGTVRVESESGVGSTFYVELPDS
jgi:two-component system phosphate regulon sensor histidine kinase PhoR